MTAVLLLLHDAWPYVAAALTLVLAALTSAHIILHKSDSRAAVAWVGLVWLAPVVGSVMYVVFGINRIRRRATGRRQRRRIRLLPSWGQETQRIDMRALDPGCAPPITRLPDPARHLAPLALLIDRVTGRPLAEGNAIDPLQDGDEAFPAMTAAIDSAERSVALSTYIFDSGPAGSAFQDALARAVARQVTVRVLVDAVGARYSWPLIGGRLRRAGVPHSYFERTRLPWRMPYMNLRNHRKLLIVDGAVGFTGGLNIREGSVMASAPSAPVRDLHFRLQGPVVAHLMETFAEDWSYAAGETLAGPAWFPSLDPVGEVLARGITDGPDRDFDKARFTLLGALAAARSSITIITPYFLPDAGLISALGVAAMRGVRVDIILPERGNLALVQWAATAQLWQVLQRGCRVFQTAPPFDHAKLMIVDDVWCRFGSTNWDPRSLRLNFEFDVECYDAVLAKRLSACVADRLARARPLTLADVDGRSIPIRLRDGLARLAAPYL